MKPEEKQQRIAIIGGGMAGLSLGYFLGKAGYAVSVLEKGKQLSGLLAYTTVPPPQEVPIERYYHHFFTNDHHLLLLLEELGLSTHVLWRESAGAVYQNGKLFPLTTRSDYFRLPLLSMTAKIRGAFATLLLRLLRPQVLRARVTAEELLRRLFGVQGYETLWRPLLVNKFGEADARRISARWIAKRIQLRSGSQRRGREVLGYLKGSYRILAEGLRDAILNNGGSIVLGTKVASIAQTSDGRHRINAEEYDVVVSTLAPDLIKRIVPQLEVPSVTYRSAICPLLFLRSAITPYYWINNLDMDVPFSVVVNQQMLLPSGYYHGTYPLYIGHYVAETSELFQKSDEELFHYYLSFLKKIFPGIEQEVIGYEIGRAKHTQPVVTAPWRPLQHTTNLPNFYMTSMAHIFPEDRGVNYAIREARRITALLKARVSRTHGFSESTQVR